jgi:hypothetical protein
MNAPQLSAGMKKRLKPVSLVMVLLSFVLLYLGPVTLENDVVTIAGLVVSGVTAAIAWLAF